MIRTRPKKELNMCERPLFGKIFLFALPLMLTGMLQLLYNAADIIVLGRFASDDSAGAVGSTGALVNLITNLFIGLSIGACSAAARWIGAKNDARVDRITHTAIAISLIGGVAIGLVGVFCSRSLLVLMNVPEDSLLPLSTLYLQIYFAGMPFNLLYNFGSSLLRARGDTKNPLLFLALSGILNVGLNILLVAVFSMDVAGVAIATVSSQVLSSLLVLVHLTRVRGHCRLSLKKLRLHKDALGDILRIGLPAGVQGCIFSLSNVVIQSSINGFGKFAVTANAEAANVEGFVYTAMNAISQACLTFTGQNYGAGIKKNIDVTLVNCLIIVTGVGLVLGVSVYLLGSVLMSVYTDSPEIIRMGVDRMSVICTTYFLCGIMEVFVGSLRGLGHSVVPMVVSILGACGFRLLYIFTIFAHYQTLLVLYLSYPASWILTAVAHAIYLFFVRKKEFRRISPPTPPDAELPLDSAEAQ